MSLVGGRVDTVEAGAPARWRPSRFALGLGSAVLLAIAIRCLYAWFVGRHLVFGYDSLWYLLVGKQLAGGYGYVDPTALITTGKSLPTANFPPGYPVLIALCHHLGLGTAFRLQIVGAGLGGVTVLLTGLLGRRLAGPRVGLCAALLAACWPSLIAADGSDMAETLALPLILTSLLAVLTAQRSAGLRPWLIAALPLSAAVLTRSELPIFAACLVGLAVATGGPGRRRRALGALAMCAIVAVCFAAWTVNRTSAVGSEALLATNGPKTLAGANCHETYYGDDLGGWDNACVAAAVRGATAEQLQVERARAEALDYIRGHAARVPLVVAARELRLFGVWSPDVLARDEVEESRNATWQRFAWWVGILTLPAAAAGSVVLCRRRPIVLAPLAAAIVATAITWGDQRFRLIADPFLIIGIAVVIERIARMRRS